MTNKDKAAKGRGKCSVTPKTEGAGQGKRNTWLGRSSTRWSKVTQRGRNEPGIGEERRVVGGRKIAEVTPCDSLLIDSSLQCHSETTRWSQTQSGTQTSA